MHQSAQHSPHGTLTKSLQRSFDVTPGSGVRILGEVGLGVAWPYPWKVNGGNSSPCQGSRGAAARLLEGATRRGKALRARGMPLRGGESAPRRRRPQSGAEDGRAERNATHTTSRAVHGVSSLGAKAPTRQSADVLPDGASRPPRAAPTGVATPGR